MKTIAKKTKKAVLITTASFFTMVAAASAFQTQPQADESAYLIQGASQATMNALVERVGGEVIHNFDVIQAVSAELSADQVKALNEINPLLRVTTKAEGEETAAILWGKGSGGNKNLNAAILWGKGSGGNKIA